MAIVEVICKHLKNNPHCPHGPTLKFVRVQNGCRQEFFACSTYRDRKDCRFYLAAGDKLTDKMQQVWALEKQSVLPYVCCAAMETRLIEVKDVHASDRLYCHTCCQLDLMSRREQHDEHDVQMVISDDMLTHPSQILKPKTKSKNEAQYLFSTATTQMIVNNLQRAGVSRVLCLGVPRVHEHIQSGSDGMQSLLLDLDHRYHSFWSSNKFIWYNMFNHHILSTPCNTPRNVLRKFLATDAQIALVMDPPFGGHIEPLAATINYFAKMVARRKQNNKLFVIWVFPYFREHHITQKCPSLLMSDYKVQYDNHKEFNNGASGRKLGSPVRLFTNMDLKEFVLPKSEGYRYCNPCGKWVSAENKHCSECNICPSKDGRTYVHCNSCGSCVKPQWQHCVKCQRCLPFEHICSALEKRLPNDENLEPRHKRLKTTFKKTKWKKKNKK